jgi:chaperonin cofactor prefoldin
MAIKKPNDKNTKAEILAAFNELLSEKKTLELQLSGAKQPEVERNGKSTPTPEIQMNSAPANLQKIESIIEVLSRLQFNFGSAVSDLSEKLATEAVKLQEMRQSVEEEVQQLEALHGLQVTEESLDTLIQQYNDSSKTFNEEFSQQRETIDQEITQDKKAWAKEIEEHRRVVKERNETLSKTKLRDAQEYTYDLNLQRNLDNQTYDQNKKRLYQELEDFQQLQEKQWAEREKAISEREKQFTEAKTKIEGYPKELEAAIKRAKEEGKGIAYHQAKVKADLNAKEVEGSKRTYELRIHSLQETIENQETRLQNLSRQLDAALKQVQDLAVKAIEGSSNNNSFQAVKEIALEQAKNPNKNK